MCSLHYSFSQYSKHERLHIKSLASKLLDVSPCVLGAWPAVAGQAPFARHLYGVPISGCFRGVASSEELGGAHNAQPALDCMTRPTVVSVASLDA